MVWQLSRKYRGPNKHSTSGYKPSAHGAKCSECPFVNQMGPTVPQGPKNPSLVLIGDVPDGLSTYLERPVSGEAAQNIYKAAAKKGVAKSKIYRTYAVLCKPAHKDDIPQAVECCRPRLEKEMAALQGDAPVLAMGGAAKAATGLKDLLPQTYYDRYATATVNPHSAFVRSADKAKVLFHIALDRAIKKAVYEWPEMVWEPNERALELLKKMCAPPSVDLEMSRTGEVLAIGLSNGNSAVSVPWDTYHTMGFGTVVGVKDKTDPLSVAIAGEVHRLIDGQGIIAHNSAFDLTELREAGFSPSHVDFDSLYSHAIVWPQLRHGLEEVALMLLPIPDRWKTAFKVKDDEKVSDAWKESDPIKLRIYNCKDAVIPAVITKILRKLLNQTHLGEHFYDRLLQVSLDMAEPYKEGILVDRAAQKRIRKQLAEMRDAAEMRAKKYFGDINIRSPKQLSEAYGRLGAPIIKKNKNGSRKLNKSVLNIYLKSDVPEISNATQALKDYRGFDKLIGSFIDNLYVDDNNHCHPQAKCFGALSGRYAYKDPVINTTPPLLRPMFRARPGHAILDPDLAQAELRLIALYSGDKNMLERFHNNEDLHYFLAAGVYNKPISEISKKERKVIKPFNFAVPYSPANRKIALSSLFQIVRLQIPNITMAQVAVVYDTYWRLFPEIARYRKETYRQAQLDGYVEEPLSGRRRYFVGPRKLIKDTECYNFRPQAGTSGIMYHATERLKKQFADHTRLLFQVHDALAMETQLDAVDTMAQSVMDYMPSRQEYNGNWIDMTCSVSAGPSWGLSFESSDMKTWEGSFGGLGLDANWDQGEWSYSSKLIEVANRKVGNGGIVDGMRAIALDVGRIVKHTSFKDVDSKAVLRDAGIVYKRLGG